MPHADKEVRRKYLQAYHQKNRDERIEYLREYRKRPGAQKSSKIHVWKRLGIRCDEEWDEVHDWWLNAKTCDICDTIFEDSFQKCLDHDHTLEGYNIRGILCKKCNCYQNEL